MNTQVTNELWKVTNSFEQSPSYLFKKAWHDMGDLQMNHPVYRETQSSHVTNALTDVTNSFSQSSFYL